MCVNMIVRKDFRKANFAAHQCANRYTVISKHYEVRHSTVRDSLKVENIQDS